jgi:hypothetical protein
VHRSHHRPHLEGPLAVTTSDRSECRAAEWTLTLGDFVCPLLTHFHILLRPSFPSVFLAADPPHPKSLAMSAPASSSSSSSSRLRRVVILGDLGTGKSYVVNHFLAAGSSAAPSGWSTHAVTTRATIYRSKPSPSEVFDLIDTVGLNMEGCEAGVPVDMVEGYHVHFIVLLDNPRCGDQRAQMEQKLRGFNTSGNVTWWTAHDSLLSKSPEKKPDPVENLLRLNLSTLRFSYISSAPAAVSSQTAAAFPQTKKKTVDGAAVWLSPAMPKKASKKEVQKALHRNHMFGNAPLRDPALNLLTDSARLFPTMPPQKLLTTSDWMAIKTLEDVKKYRQKGDRLLELHFLMIDENQAENWSMNQTLCDRIFPQVPELQEHIDRIYGKQHDHVMTQEKYGDYIEALFWVIMTGKKRTAVDFLRRCVNAPGQPPLF